MASSYVRAFRVFRGPCIFVHEKHYRHEKAHNASGFCVAAPSNFVPKIGQGETSLDKTLTKAGWLRVDPHGLKLGIPPAGVAVNAEVGVSIGFAPSRQNDVGPAALALPPKQRRCHL